MVRRGFGLVVEGLSASADFGGDVLDGLAPDERGGVVVPVFYPRLDRWVFADGRFVQHDVHFQARLDVHVQVLEESEDFVGGCHG